MRSGGFHCRPKLPRPSITLACQCSDVSETRSASFLPPIMTASPVPASLPTPAAAGPTSPRRPSYISLSAAIARSHFPAVARPDRRALCMSHSTPGENTPAPPPSPALAAAAAAASDWTTWTSAHSPAAAHAYAAETNALPSRSSPNLARAASRTRRDSSHRPMRPRSSIRIVSSRCTSCADHRLSDPPPPPPPPFLLTEEVPSAGGRTPSPSTPPPPKLPCLQDSSASETAARPSSGRPSARHALRKYNWGIKVHGTCVMMVVRQ